ncbi:MAG: DNA translocase FtsK 4TM domain-containing protein [Planctomycetes bacterium]|nr:DNA translocase FtsK 4TM domain-containing protein [Planctomycetota bacterium]
MTAEKRALLFRILSVGAFFAALFLVASLVTHDWDDPPGGPSRTIHNICGIAGAYVSHHLITAAGWANYLVIAAAMAVIGAYVIRGQVSRRYVLTVACVALGLFLVLSLFSYEPATDPHRSYTEGQRAAYDNACGRAGAVVGYYLFSYVGIGIWFAVLAGFVALAATIARFQVADRALRAVGVLLLVCFASTLAATLQEHGAIQPAAADVLPEGYGGLLGLLLTKHLLIKFGSVGSYLLLAFVGLVGLVLSTDTVILLFPLAIYRWLHKRRIARFDALRQASDRILNGFHAAREAMAAGAVATAAAATVKRSQPKIRRNGKDESEEAETPAAKPKAAKSEPPAAEEEPQAAEPASRKQEVRVAPKIRLPKDRAAQAAASDDRPSREKFNLVDAAEGPGENVPAYDFPALDLLDPPEEFDISGEEVSIRQNAVNLEGTLKQFGVEAEVVGIDTGPVITQYEVNLGAGIKVGKVISLSDDLAIGLKASSVRIVAPLPGRGTIGIEVPNQHRKTVNLRESIEDGLPLSKRCNLPLFLGKDSAGNPLIRDLTAMPHLLIGGTTGSGKSVCLNSIIMSILYTRSPRDVKFILVDPKMVEMTMFASIPHLMCPVVSDMSRVQSILEWLISKMQERYGMLAEAGVKNIVGYNALTREQIIERFKPTSEEDKMRLTYHMPYIVLVVDELADLMMTCAKEAEAAITRLAQKSRAVGIHLILATQRPSVDVVTGLIKSNHPCRVAFQVASRVDSRTILDSMGAEKLLGRGDMLLMQPGANKLLRAQCTYVSEKEISTVVEHVSQGGKCEFNRELVQLKPKPPSTGRGRGGAAAGDDDSSFAERDDMYVDAVRVVLQHQRGSVSLLQRKLGIGYGRASRLIDFMAEDGLVGEYQGSQAREALISLDEWEAGRGEGEGVGAVAGLGDDEDLEEEGDDLDDE